jgi:hypothetical protein
MKTKPKSVAASNLDAYFRSTKAPGPLEVKVGDRVARTRYFLKQLGLPPGDDAWKDRGTVLEIRGNNIVSVKWDSREEPTSILTSNLAFPGPNLRFAGD